MTAGSEDLPGNLGMWDQLGGLQWIQKNIASFGGDPNKVTIFGESAGGWSISYLLASPQSKGLYQAAIVQSGGLDMGLLHIEKAKALPELHKDFVGKVGCSLKDSTLECLQKKSVEELMKYFSMFDECNGGFYGFYYQFSVL